MTSQTQPIDLYFWTTPNGFKVSIMLEELGVPYNVHFVNIGKGEQFEPDFLKVSPNNKIPAIVDPEGPDGAPISVFESGAILIYLARKFGRFYGKDERTRVAVEEWLMWQMAGFGPILGQNHHFNIYAPEKLPYAMKRFTDETHRLYGVLNRRLEGRDYVCDDFSIADMAMIGWARGWKRQQMDIAEFPNVGRWIETMEARPGVQRGLAYKPPEAMDLVNDPKAKAIMFGQR